MTPRRFDRSIPDPNLEPTISVPRAGRIVGMSRNTSYAAARDGRLPVVPLSKNRVVVVTAEFLEKYRLRRVPATAPPATWPQERFGPRPARQIRGARTA